MKVEYLLPPKRMNKTISHLPGVVTSVAIEAEEIAIRARVLLGMHKPGKDGEIGPSRITLTHGRIDSFVNLEDDKAAGAIDSQLHILWGAAGII